MEIAMPAHVLGAMKLAGGFSDLRSSGDSKGFIMSSDQRRHKRFKARGEVFAAFVMPNKPIIVGRVLDVSPWGAGVQYVSTRKLETGPTSIKLFGLNSPQMEKMESTVVYDQEIPEQSRIIPKVRRCGIKFERLRSEVQAKLKELSKAHPRSWNARQGVASVSRHAVLMFQ